MKLYIAPMFDTYSFVKYCRIDTKLQLCFLSIWLLKSNVVNLIDRDVESFIDEL